MLYRLKTAREDFDPEQRKQLFQQYTDRLRNEGVYAGTSHKRITIPKEKLDEHDLLQLGFEKVLLAIPEAGQDQFSSYRHPDNLFHLHSHPGRWTMHEDNHASSTMLSRKLGPVRAALEGIPHVVTEGIPGLANYLGGRIAGRKSTADEVERQLLTPKQLPPPVATPASHQLPEKTAMYRLKLSAAYKRKTYKGLSFVIDRPKGYKKTWPLPGGGEKVFVYPVDYGFFPGVDGEDGEGLDAFVGSDPEGHLEAFQKLRRDEKGRQVLDETKFLIGVTDAEREAIYRLYGSEIWARRVFHDVKDVQDAVQKFKKQKKPRYKQASLNGVQIDQDPEQNPDYAAIATTSAISNALRNQGRSVSGWSRNSDENTFNAGMQEGSAQ